MGIPLPYTTPLELRSEKDGRRMMLYFDGQRIPGITEINVNNEMGHHPVVTVTIIGSAVRFATEEKPPIPEGVYYSRHYPEFYYQDGSGLVGNGFYNKWIDRKDEFPDG